VIFGPVANDHVRHLHDIGGREKLVMLSLAVAVLLVGLYPLPLSEILHASVNDLLVHLARSKI